MLPVLRPSTPMSPTCTLFGMPPRAMTAQFSNSNGGISRSFSTVHGRSRTTKPRPARQSGSLSGNAQTARRRLARMRQAVGEISMPIPTRGFSRGWRHFLSAPMQFLRYCSFSRKNFMLESSGNESELVPPFKAGTFVTAIQLPVVRLVRCWTLNPATASHCIVN